MLFAIVPAAAAAALVFGYCLSITGWPRDEPEAPESRAVDFDISVVDAATGNPIPMARLAPAFGGGEGRETYGAWSTTDPSGRMRYTRVYSARRSLGSDGQFHDFVDLDYDEEMCWNWLRVEADGYDPVTIKIHGRGEIAYEDRRPFPVTVRLHRTSSPVEPGIGDEEGTP